MSDTNTSKTRLDSGEKEFRAGWTLTKKLLMNGVITIFSACMVAGSTTVFLVLISLALQKARGTASAKETLTSLDEAQNLLSMGIIVVIVTVILACIFVMGPIAIVILQVTKQIRSLDASVEALSKSNFTVLPQVLGKDDLAGMAWKLRQTIRILSDTMATVQSAAERVDSAASELGASSTSSDKAAQATSTTLGNALEKTERSRAVTNDADEARTELQEQMVVMSGASTKAGELSERAVAAVQTASDSVSALTSAADQISTVVNTIADIAEQTNLLALNATIEAARAGEAGKGFAVVADQVKSLSTETAGATADVSTKVQSIQDSTASAVAEIESISQVVEEMAAVQNEIASALIAQDASARRLMDSLGQMDTCVGNMTGLMNEAVELSGENTKAASDVSQTAASLSRQAEKLHILVSRFTFEGHEATFKC
ncbi:MAG: methyl-accepting chemotaxis protein [Mobiluncus porci]|uniref:Methyl-accepting chemotaxis protein n=1 Tax=Mobiluncus porci TaxID=2652278 RepID=A0A7K0K4L9_9ACTO|nr:MULTISPECIES: methyl-accepting chemotaxis protein [Mobiluncus]MCI6584406.1 methyl-accepting chemotaxis protein [Mobiluncus sp.]MDD7541826.1 methyl-accepting chemotaxis protein [Mobiluncus porci]MDY5748674.1 methyl-accepting chemotaxis protein [Mobiluncus porci]MST50423.1 methyl-accepting chemotaxis protein [Mobiluncus porci]